MSAILLSAVLAAGFGGLTSASAAIVAPTPVKVATYNVCAEAVHCPDLVAWSTRVKNVAAQVKLASPDVITFQQLGTSGTHVPAMTSALGTSYTKVAGSNARYIYFKNTTMARTSTSGANLAAGTFTVQATSTSKLTYVPYSVLRQKSTNAKLLVVDLHLTSLDSLTSDQNRLTEMNQTMTKIAPTQTANPGIPTIFSGDFNSLTRHHVDPYESDVNRYRVNEMLLSKGYSDAKTVAEVTVNGELGSLNQTPTDTRNFGPGFELDHFYVKTGTRVSAWTLVNRDVTYASQYSDHDMTYMTAYLPVVK